MRLIPPPGERALPVAAGLLLALSYPPVELLLPAFIGLVPLLVFLADRPLGPRGRWAATRAGLVTGFIYFGIQLYWFAVALIRHSFLALPAYLSIVLVLTGLAGAFAWAVHYARGRIGLNVAVSAVLFWPLLEWVQGHLGDLAFPWLGLGAALAPFPALAGAADLVGGRGLTVWVVAVNGVLALMVLRYRQGRAVRGHAIGLAALVLLPVAYGVVRYRTVELRPAARVAVVQPNIPEELKTDWSIALDTSMSALRNLTEPLADEALDLVIWPEVALPVDFLHSPSTVAVTEELSRRIGAPILVGTYGVDVGEFRVAFNSALLVDSGGPRGARYDKRRLVPFVERVPFVDPEWLRGVVDFRYFGTLGQGRHAPVYEVGPDARFGTLICYESIFAPLSADYRRDHADFLVNITNDAWFGRREWWGRSNALWQHPAHMVLRAIENRIGVARAANTGISMFVDPLGRTYQETALFEPAVRVGTVYTTAERTLFTRWGDWLTTLVVMVAVGALGLARFRPSKRHHTTPPSTTGPGQGNGERGGG